MKARDLIIVATLVSCQHTTRKQDQAPTQQRARDGALISPSQVTAGNASSFSPALSFDGEFLVYSSDKRGNKDLWIRRVAGGFAQALTQHSADDFAPSFSPNRRRLAFASRREDAGGDIHVLKISRNMREGEPVGVIHSPNTIDTHPSWFPDGERLLFSSRSPGEIVPSIMIASAEDGQPRPLYRDLRGHYPTVHPDGTKVAYSRAGHILVFDLKTRIEKQITSPSYGRDGQPQFTPDGRALLFIRYLDDTNGDGALDAGDRPAIWKVSMDATTKYLTFSDHLEIVPLTPPMTGVFYPVVRGANLYFTQEDEGNLDIYSLPSSGSIETIQTTEVLDDMLTRTTSEEQHLFLLRRALAEAVQGQHRSLAIYAGYKLLTKYADLGRTELAHLLQRQLDFHFGDDQQLMQLAHIQMIRLRTRTSKLSSTKELDPYVGDANNIVSATAMLAKSEVLNQNKDYFDAMALLEEIQRLHPQVKEIYSIAGVMAAELAFAVSDRDTAIANALSKLERSDLDILHRRRLASFILHEQDKKRGSIKEFQQLKDRAKSLPMMSSMIHLAIVRRYLEADKPIVAINELRILCDQPTTDADIALQAGKLLGELAIKHRREQGVAKTFERLQQRLHRMPQAQRRAKALHVLFLNKSGGILIERGQRPAAIGRFQQALNIEPTNIEANRRIIELQAASRDFLLNTQKRLTELAEQSDNDVYIYFSGLAQAYLVDLEMSISGKLSRIDDAIEVLEDFRESNSQLAEAHLTLGWLYSQKAHWLREYEIRGGVASILGPKWNTASVGDLVDITIDWRVLNVFATTEENWYEHAIDAFLLAYHLTSDSSTGRIPVLRNLANTFYDLQNFPKALSYFVERIQAMSLVPIPDTRTKAAFMARAGRCAFQAGELALARHLQEQAASLWEETDEESLAHQQFDALALTLRTLGEFSEAAKIYEFLGESAQDVQNRVNARTNLGYSLYRLRKFQDALDVWDQIEKELESDATSPSREIFGSDIEYVQHHLKINAYRQFLLTEVGNLEGAVHNLSERHQLLKKLHDIDPQRPIENADNVNYLQAAAAIENNLGVHWLNLGNLHRSREHFQLAVNIFQKISNEEISDDALRVQSNLARAYVDSVMDVDRITQAYLQKIDATITKLRMPTRNLSEQHRRHLVNLVMLRKVLAGYGNGSSGDFDAEAFKEIVQPIMNTPEADRLVFQWSSVGDYVPSEDAFVSLRQAYRDNLIDSDKEIWPYHFANNAWKGALASWEHRVDTGSASTGIYQRRLAQNLFSKATESAEDHPLTEPVRHLNYQIKELANRLDQHRRQLLKGDKDRSTYEWVVDAIDSDYLQALSSSEAVVVLLNKPKDAVIKLIGSNGSVTIAESCPSPEQASIDGSCINRFFKKFQAVDHFFISVDLNFPLPLLSTIAENRSSSLLPSPALLPTIKDREYLGSAFVALLGSDEDLASDSTMFISNIANEDLSDQIHRFQGLYITRPFQLNTFQGQRSYISPKDSKRFLTNLYVSRFRKSNHIGPQWAYISDPRTDDRKIELAEPYIATGLAFLQAGMRSIAFATKDVALSPDDVGRGIAVEGTTHLHIGIPLRMPEGIDSDSLMDTLDELQDQVDASEDERDWQAMAASISQMVPIARQLDDQEIAADALRQLAAVVHRQGNKSGAFQLSRYLSNEIAKAQGSLAGCEATLETAAYGFWANKVDEVDALLASCIKIFRDEEDQLGVAKILHYQALIAEKRQAFTAAIAHYQAAADLYDDEDEPLDKASKLKAIGNIQLKYLSNFAAALDYFKQASQIYADEEALDAQAALTIDRANALIALGQVRGAIDLLTEMLTTVDLASQFKTWVRAKQNLAFGQYRAKDLVLARKQIDAILNQLPDAEAVNTDASTVGLRIDALNLKALLDAEMGRFQETFATLDRGLELARMHRLKSKEAFLLSNYGYWLRETGDFDKALATLKQVLEIDRSLADERGIAFDYRNIGLAYLAVGKIKKAAGILRKALKESVRLSIPYNETFTLLAQGEVFIRQHKFEQALKKFERTVKQAKKYSLFDFGWKAIFGKALALDSLQQTADARVALLQAIAEIEESPPGLKSTVSRSGLLANISVYEVYDFAVSFFMRANDPAMAFQIAERGKHRQYIDNFAAGEFDHHNPAVVKDLKRLQKAKTAARLATLLGSTADGQLAAKLGAHQQASKRLMDDLRKSLREQEPLLVDLFEVRKTSLPSIQSELPQGVQYLSYWVGTKQTHLWQVTNQDFRHFPISDNYMDMNRRIADFNQIVEEYSSTIYLGASLYNSLLKPAIKSLGSFSRLVVSPHLALHQLSLEALDTGNGELVTKAVISYLPHGFLLAAKNDQSTIPTKPKVVSIAHRSMEGLSPIPFAGRESDVVSRYFDNVTTLIDSHDSMDFLQTRPAAAADILHIASHGLFDEKVPANSGIALLANGKRQLLTSRDVFAMPGVPKLVVFSACNATGPTQIGEEALSLNRTMLIKRSRGVVSSLWRLDDVASAVLVKRFLRYVSEGYSGPEALRKSKLTVRKYFPHPAYWAALTYHGS